MKKATHPKPGSEFISSDGVAFNCLDGGAQKVALTSKGERQTKMKTKTHTPRLKFWPLITIGILMTAANSNLAQVGQPENIDVIGRLTRYAVKPAYQEDFRKALSDYVLHAVAKEKNIQAEAYFEQDNQSVLWLIERWKNRKELDRFASSQQSKAIHSLKLTALSTNAEIYYVTDLEPISRQ